MKESSPGTEGCGESPFMDQRGGSFRLFRSRSWSLRRKKSLDGSPIETTEPRLSPSYSVKSQDSGFSDSGENGTSGHLKNSTSALQRTQFFSTNEYEDESDPNLTQVPDFAIPNPVSMTGLASNPNPLSTLTAKQKLEQSLGNIASVNEGLRLKRAFLDEVSLLKVAADVP